MTRQWLNAPGTEDHAKRLEHMKGLATADERRDYLAEVRAQRGHFWRDYLADDFAAWWPTRQREAA